MALTKEDLQAIAALMDNKLGPVRGDIADIRANMATKADIADIKDELSDVHNGINAMVEWIEDIDNRKQDAV